ncbi:hypothetical protein GTV32_22095 [Gordonia sp. SID5947]|uniref:Rv0361 family membrane protein n=1 Tax=Gordonia sp. SID5947 TaxID=2690315 RepID=UPI0013693BD8|nr:hypothetical protein [Gordonia sp. SID5947]MYR08838.1 hypothetical protein [Gordonia sp. SID5947]
MPGPPTGAAPYPPPYGATPYGAPQYGPTQYGPPQYGPPPYPQFSHGGFPPAAYGPGGYPMPYPPRRRHTGAVIAAAVVGMLVIVAMAALFVTAAVRSADPDTGDVAVNTPPTAADGQPRTGSGGTAANQAEVTAIRSAMQNFVDAVNSRDVGRIQASVCSVVRPQVTHPLDLTGNVVLDELSAVTVTGDSAESTVSTHLELGNQRSSPKQNPESFTRENGTWFVCPGAEPDIGT